MSTGTDDTLNTSSEPDEYLAPGTMFGPYEIAGLLGKGGMGAVYEATHTLLKKRVALKTLHASSVRNAQARARFVREGQAASKLDHPHVVSVSDVGIQDGVPYLVMELMTGEDLAVHLKREKGLSVERVAEIMVPVCTAVQAAHRVGIIHRDLKPENIFLAKNAIGQIMPKVLDFGISKLTDNPAEQSLTGSGALMGTSYYMSPEQAMGAKTVDARSDQYTLGVILYECVTGRRAFTGETLYQIIFAITEARFDHPRVLRPDLPERFEAMILRAMSFDAGKRFASCDDLARELLAFGDAKTVGAWEPHLGAPAEAPPPTEASARGASEAAALAADAPRPDTLSDTAKEIEKLGITAKPPGRSRQFMVVAGLAAMVLGAVGWASWSHSPSVPGAGASATAATVHAASTRVMPPEVLAAPTAATPITPVPVAATPPALVTPDAGVPSAATPLPSVATSPVVGAARGRRRRRGPDADGAPTGATIQQAVTAPAAPPPAQPGAAPAHSRVPIESQ